MKFQSWLMLLMAVILMSLSLMAAAPNQPAGPPSAWDKIKNSVKHLLPHREAPKPLTQRKVQTRPDARASANRAGSDLSAQQQPTRRDPTTQRDLPIRRDPQVQQATAIESPAPRAATARPLRKPAKPSLFSREKRPTRTLSQYMAEEKP